ncbi:hypothetical protein Tsubulata_041969, partial [Turnera subulata]
MAFLRFTTALLSKFLASPFRSASARAFRSTTAASSSPRDGADDGPTATQNASDHYDNVADFSSFVHGLSTEDQVKIFGRPSNELKDMLFVAGYKANLEVKRRVIARKPPANLDICEMFEWNPFQVAGKSDSFQWKFDEEDGSLCLQIDVPGAAAGDVKVELEDGVVSFTAQEKGRRIPGARKYSGYLPFAAGKYRIEEATVTVKYGVLKIIIPRIFKEQGLHKERSKPQVELERSNDELLVFGQPEPFDEDEEFKDCEKDLYTKVELPLEVFNENVKLWVNYSSMYLTGIDLKREVYHFFNYDEDDTSILNWKFMLVLAVKEKDNSSSGEGVMFTRVELPGPYKEIAKLWVRSDRIYVTVRETKDRREGTIDLDLTKTE